MAVERLDSAPSRMTDVLVFSCFLGHQMSLSGGDVRKMWGPIQTGTNHSIPLNLSFLLSEMWGEVPDCGWLS